MNAYVASVALGVAVGAIYGLVQVRSPAPPIVTLVGLFGMVVGEGAVDVAKHHFRTELQELSQPAPDGIRAPHPSNSR